MNSPDQITRKPDRDRNGLPTCSREDCPQFDGKRCREMGFRPAAHCEPQLLDDYASLRQSGRAAERADVLAECERTERTSCTDGADTVEAMRVRIQRGEHVRGGG